MNDFLKLLGAALAGVTAGTGATAVAGSPESQIATAVTAVVSTVIAWLLKNKKP